MKKLFILLLCFFSFSSFASQANCDLFACPMADTNSSKFCQQFVTAAHCYCGKHFPQAYCNELPMMDLYNILLASTREHTLKAACKKQQDISEDICVKHWTFYLNRCSRV